MKRSSRKMFKTLLPFRVSFALALTLLTTFVVSGSFAATTASTRRTTVRTTPVRKHVVPTPKATPTVAPLSTVDYLLFCNRPERLTNGGAYADMLLTGGKTYRIFFHYRNASGQAAPFVVAFQGSVGKSLTLDVRKGIADASNDPPRAGQQALARYLQDTQRRYVGKGGVRFPLTLKKWEVASGIVTVRAKQDVRLRIYFKDNKRVVKQAHVAQFATGRREMTITLSDKNRAQYIRIGSPALTERSDWDGTYGMVYAFTVKAPAGRKVRVAFSPRGGQSGLVGSLGGKFAQSSIVGPSGWAVLGEAVVGKDGLVFLTIPFGGVFYPVEVAFRLL